MWYEHLVACRAVASARTKLRSGRILLHDFSINGRPGAVQMLALQHLQVQQSVRILDESAMPITGFVRCGSGAGHAQHPIAQMHPHCCANAGKHRWNPYLTHARIHTGGRDRRRIAALIRHAAAPSPTRACALSLPARTQASVAQ